MFRSFTVKNFRCFRELTLAPLERINLIAGKNNTGKTALLEAIHLFCNPNDCQLSININETRGIEEPGKDKEAMGSWMFSNRNPSKDIEFSAEEEVKRTLKITLADSLSAREILPDRERNMIGTFNPESVDFNGPYFILRYRESEGEWLHSVGLPARGGNGMIWIKTRIPHPIDSKFLSSMKVNPAKDVEEFGKLEAAKRQEEILPALRLLEPRLNRLSLIPFAGKPVIHGDMEGQSQLMPIPLMGEGIRRLLSILLAIVNARNGVVLVDEIENGLHYSVLTQVWQAIGKAARQTMAQVFTTTHSYECIQAAHQAFNVSGDPGLRLFRLDRIDGDIRVAVYDQEILGFATEMSHEVR